MNKVDLALEFLKSLEAEFKFKKVPTLKPINEYLDYFKRPELSYKNRVIVSGTAGKGSTCRAIEEVLIKNNVSTLTLYSPHIQSVLERVRINGKLIDKNLFSEILFEIRNAHNELKVRISYYECLVLLGILAGEKKNCNTLICEVGLGGNFDATNAIQGDRISAITFIGLDHTLILGDSTEKIAEKKLGIVNLDTKYFLTYEKNLKEFFNEKSIIKPEFFNFSESPNENLGVKICEKILNKKIDYIPKVKLPCRFERVSKNVILDGAHSAPRFKDVAKKIKKIEGKKIGIIGMVQNHDMEDLSSVIDLFDEIIWTKINFLKSFWDPNVLKEHFKVGKIILNPLEAVDEYERKDSTIIVLGSFYLAGFVREKYISTKYIEENHCEFLYSSSNNSL